jgi:hypothetical protein
VLSESVIKSNQLDEGIKYITDLVRKQGADASINDEDFKREAGVGIVVTDEEILAKLDSIFAEHDAAIKE